MMSLLQDPGPGLRAVPCPAMRSLPSSLLPPATHENSQWGFGWVGGIFHERDGCDLLAACHVLWGGVCVRGGEEGEGGGAHVAELTWSAAAPVALCMRLSPTPGSLCHVLGHTHRPQPRPVCSFWRGCSWCGSSCPDDALLSVRLAGATELPPPAQNGAAGGGSAAGDRSRAAPS